jgi:hypothetical protein
MLLIINRSNKLYQGQEVWVMHKKKVTKWTIFILDYDFFGNKFVKLKNGKEFILTTRDKIFTKKEYCI